MVYRPDTGYDPIELSDQNLQNVNSFCQAWMSDIKIKMKHRSSKLLSFIVLISFNTAYSLFDFKELKESSFDLQIGKSAVLKNVRVFYSGLMVVFYKLSDIYLSKSRISLSVS